MLLVIYLCYGRLKGADQAGYELVGKIAQDGIIQYVTRRARTLVCVCVRLVISVNAT